MKKILSFIIVVIAVVAFSGCKPRHVTSEYRVATIEELRAAENVDVKFRIPFGTNIQTVIQDLIDSFNEEYPNVTITLDVIGGYDPMKTATINDIAGGVAPTMTVGYPDHFAEYLITESIIPLDPFIESDDPVIGYTDAEINDFLPGYLQESTQFDQEGSIMGLPFNKSTEALYYNKNFFDEFNLTVPTTWAEVESVATQINTIVAGLENGQYSWMGDIKTNYDAGKFLPLMYDSTGNLFTTAIHQFGGEYTKSIYRAGGVTDVQNGLLKFQEDAKAKEALTFMQDLAKAKLMNVPEAWEGSYGSNFFINSQIIMNIGSTAGSSYYNDSIAEWEVAPIPYYDAEHKFVIQQGTNVCIFSQASDLEKLAAWLFVKHCLTPENTADFAIRTGYMPVRASAYELAAYKDFLENPTPDNIATSKVHNATKAYSGNGWNYFVDAAWSGSNKVRTEVGTAVSQILVYNADVQTAFDEAVARIGQ